MRHCSGDWRGLIDRIRNNNAWLVESLKAVVIKSEKDYLYVNNEAEECCTDPQELAQLAQDCERLAELGVAGYIVALVVKKN